MGARDIIVIGGSFGAVTALVDLVRYLPKDLNAAIFVVLHIGARQSNLTQVLGRAAGLPVHQALDLQEIEAGRIYVAPPDEHLMLMPGHVRLIRGPKENWNRPALDPLFRSAAIAYGPRVIGVVLTGYLDDGSAGLLAIKDRGGITIVQDPAEALAPDMPRNAAASVAVDHQCTVRDIAHHLVHYDPPRLESVAPVSLLIEMEHKLTALETFLATEAELARLGDPSGLTCPECGGALYELKDKRVLRFRCRAGHALSSHTLLHALSIERERAQSAAVRSMQEEAALAREIALGMRKTRAAPLDPTLSSQAHQLIERADQIARLAGLLDGSQGLPSSAR